MTSDHSIQFEAANITVGARFVGFNQTGRLTVNVAGHEIACVEWIDDDAKYYTNEGLKAAALSEIRTQADYLPEMIADESDAAVKAKLELILGQCRAIVKG